MRPRSFSRRRNINFLVIVTVTVNTAQIHLGTCHLYQSNQKIEKLSDDRARGAHAQHRMLFSAGDWQNVRLRKWLNVSILWSNV